MLFFLQETLGITDQILSLLEAMILGWTFHALDVRGWLGSISMGINGRTMKLLNIWGWEGALMADIFWKELGLDI